MGVARDPRPGRGVGFLGPINLSLSARNVVSSHSNFNALSMKMGNVEMIYRSVLATYTKTREFISALRYP